MRIRTLALALATTLMAATAPAIAASLVPFSPREIEVIRAYYAHEHEGGGAKDHEGSAGGSREHEGSADGSKHPDGSAGGSKGKAGKPSSKGLPPGIAKNLARGKPLPPGIAKQHLPTELVRRLPPVRHGYERIVVDGRVLLIETATQTIVDAIFD